MGRKCKSQTASSNKDAANTQKFWPDLPRQLVQKITWDSTLMHDICYKGVSKSWRADSKKCTSPNLTPAPLQLLPQDHQLASFNIRFKRTSGTRWYFFSRYKQAVVDPVFNFLGSSHGYLVIPKYASASDSYQLSLSNPPEWSSCRLPPWNPSDPFLGAFLSSPSPWNRNVSNKCPTVCTAIVLTGITHPAFAFYSFGDPSLPVEREWIKEDCTIVDPHGSRRDQLMQFTNGIWHRGKFYALSLQGTVAVIEEIDSRFRITQLGKKRVVPSASSIRFTEYLVESAEGVLLVFLISSKSAHVVDDVEVYGLDTGKLVWIKRQSLGERALFLGSNCCTSVWASRVGCMRNCVYFSSDSGNGDWWVYDMQRSVISPGAEDPTLFGIGCNQPRVMRRIFISPRDHIPYA